jgi:hypothetical protein
LLDLIHKYRTPTAYNQTTAVTKMPSPTYMTKVGASGKRAAIAPMTKKAIKKMITADHIFGGFLDPIQVDFDLLLGVLGEASPRCR